MADAKPADIQDLLGGGLFKALYKWMLESGPVYLLPTGQSGGRPLASNFFKHYLCVERSAYCLRRLFLSCLCTVVTNLRRYFLHAGPISSFLVISDPDCAKHVLRATDNPSRPVYEKGLVAEVAKFLFGEGFGISGKRPVQQTTIPI